MKRRALVRGACACLFVRNGLAQAPPAYPTRPVRLVIGFPPGQATDVIARLVTERMAQRLGQPFVVDTRVGQGGGLALAHLVQQAPDGYTICFANTGAVITNTFVQKNLAYALPQLQPIALLGDLPLVLATQPGGRIRSLEDFIEQARAKPGKLSYSTPGVATTSHLAMESLKQAAKLDVVHVPYTGSNRSLTDLIAGTVDVSFDTIALIQPFVESGRLAALALGVDRRVAQMPAVPTLAEAGFPDIVGSVWVGVFAPRGLPDAVARTLEAEVAAALQDPAVSARLLGMGMVLRYVDGAGFARMLAADATKIQKVVQRSGIKPD